MIKPTLLLLTDEFPPFIRGGIASWCRNFSISLASNGYKIQIFLPKKNRNSDLQNFHRDVSFTYVRGHDWNKLRWLYMMIAVTMWLLRNRNGIIIGTTWQHVIVLVFLKKMLKTKIICFAHGTDITRAVTSSRIHHFRRTLPRIDLFVPVSKFLAEKVRLNCDSKTKTEILLNGVDCDNFCPLYAAEKSRLELNLPINVPLIISIGRLVPVKGFDVLLRAMAIVKKTYSDAKCIIVGGAAGAEYERLCQLSSELKLEDSLSFISAISYEKLPKLYDASDICVLSSVPVYKPHYEEENLPMTIIEASACGKPVIGSRCGGIPEIIAENESGLLFTPGDFNSLASSIVNLLENSELALQYGRNARKRAVEHFNLNNISSKLVELITTVSQNCSI